MTVKNIFENSNASKETWNLEDGTYKGEIIEFKGVKNNTTIIMKIRVKDDIIFMKMTPVEKYTYKPLFNLFIGIEDTDELIGKQVEFNIKNNEGNSGMIFSNITSIECI